MANMVYQRIKLFTGGYVNNL